MSCCIQSDKKGDAMSEKVDFVLTWVDGNDPDWQDVRNQHIKYSNESKNTIRFRDWDNLHYWFRGIEKFVPWVNRIHLVTWGHLPAWLNQNHPKLNIVKHEDYIPGEYLPTFSARTLELNLHRINGLTDKFVYFNDDIFITRPVKETDFFKNGKPRDIAVMDICIKGDEIHGGSLYNSIMSINKYFRKSKVVRENFFKWYNPIYGKYLLKTILLIPWKNITGFYTPHLANPFLKSTFIEVWDKEKEQLEQTSFNKFRTKMDVSQYLFRYWQLASGNFIPNRNIGQQFNLGINPEKAFKAVEKQRYKVVCLNDSELVNDFDKIKSNINYSFDKILPEKSEYEL